MKFTKSYLFDRNSPTLQSIVNDVYTHYFMIDDIQVWLHLDKKLNVTIEFQYKEFGWITEPGFDSIQELANYFHPNNFPQNIITEI